MLSLQDNHNFAIGALRENAKLRTSQRLFILSRKAGWIIAKIIFTSQYWVKLKMGLNNIAFTLTLFCCYCKQKFHYHHPRKACSFEILGFIGIWRIMVLHQDFCASYQILKLSFSWMLPAFSFIPVLYWFGVYYDRRYKATKYSLIQHFSGK